MAQCKSKGKERLVYFDDQSDIFELTVGQSVQ